VTKEKQPDMTTAHTFQPELQKIRMTGIDEAWSKVIEKKARYRFVIDTRS
jgi:D-arabinose 1-dehydrogenase-like Zn-dependent alcohol dehydrogenase